MDLKQTATDIAVQAEGEVLVDVDDTLSYVVRSLRVCDSGQEESNEPLQGILVHGVNVGQVSGTEE